MQYKQQQQQQPQQHQQQQHRLGFLKGPASEAGSRSANPSPWRGGRAASNHPQGFPSSLPFWLTEAKSHQPAAQGERKGKNVKEAHTETRASRVAPAPVRGSRSQVPGPRSAVVVRGCPGQRGSAGRGHSVTASALQTGARSCASGDCAGRVCLRAARAANPSGRVVGRDRAGLGSSPLHLLAAEFPPSASFKNQTPAANLAPWKMPAIRCTRQSAFPRMESQEGPRDHVALGRGRRKKPDLILEFSFPL